MPRMTATKPFRYAARALKVGDEFTASRRDARLLEAIGKARRYVPPKRKADPVGEDLDALRAEAEELGIDVDGRWGPSRLRAEIEQAKG